MGQFRIGWAEVDITPGKKVSLVGQFAERISEYVEKPLTATAMAMTTDDEQVVMCGCDLLGISYAMVNAVRAKLAGNGLGLDPMKVIISAIHTHTGPGYTGYGNSTQKLYGTGSSSFRALPLQRKNPPARRRFSASPGTTFT